jgi:hypothetical protein
MRRAAGWRTSRSVRLDGPSLEAMTIDFNPMLDGELRMPLKDR